MSGFIRAAGALHITGMLLLVLLLSCANAQAQSSYLMFETLSLQHGLSQSSVRSIHQDQRGYMGVCTEDGLNRYDGYTFTVFKPAPNDVHSGSSSFIRAITEDGDGNLWIGTNGWGFNRFDPSTERFYRYQADPSRENTVSHNSVWAIEEDSTGMLWIGTDGGGLDYFDPRTASFKHYRHDPADSRTLGSDNVVALLIDSRGLVWAGTRDGGLNCLDPATGTVTRYMHDPHDPGSLSHNDVRAIIEDEQGNLWIGTFGGGLNFYDRKRGRFTHYLASDRQRYALSDDRIHTLMLDREGGLWIGTNGGGLNRFSRSRGEFLASRHDPEKDYSLCNDIIFSMYEDASGVFWFGSEFGGLSKLDYFRGNFQSYRGDPDNPNSLNDNSVWALRMDRDNVLWIGTRVGGLNSFHRASNTYRHYTADPDNPFALSNNHVRCIYEDRQGLLWVGTDGGGLHRFDRSTQRFIRYMHEPAKANSISGNRVYCVFEDARGRYWVGTRTGGLNRFDPETGRFTRYRADASNPQSLSDDFVYIIRDAPGGKLWIGTFAGGLDLFDPDRGRWVHHRSVAGDSSTLSSDCVLALTTTADGTLWVGTGGGGINRYDAASGTFRCWDERDGLANNVVYAMLEDAHGRLWISTNQGISRFDPKTEEFRNYTQEDGLQSNEFNGGAYFKSPGGEMFFGGINGVNAFFPEQVYENGYIPPVYITDVKVFNTSLPIGGDSPLQRHISETDEIEFTYDQNVFSIDFVALNYTVPKKNRYRYMMEGVDEDWITADASRRSVPYMNLPPGTYVFKVMGANNDGLWNPDPATLRIVITPPFWQRWWFRVLVLLVVLLLGYLWFQRRVRNIRMKTELQTAHDAQMSIMPQHDPDVHGYDISGHCTPAFEVGGDFFDYFSLQEGAFFCVAVGDVSGKAMNSAMTAVLSSGMLAVHAEQSGSVGDILTRLNAPMYRKTERNMFTALCLLALRVGGGELRYTNAGLPFPLLRRDGEVRELSFDGPRLPLGSTPELRYAEHVLQLRAGDVLVVYTDGLSEATNSARAFYGPDRLRTVLAELDTDALDACSIKLRILENVQSFTGNAARHDDMTLVVIKVTGS